LRTETEQSGQAEADEIDVIVDLETSLTPLIEGDRLNDAKRDRQLRGLAEGERIATGQLFEYAQRLGELTEWPEATLLERIGCTIRSEEQLQTLPKERLDNCERFLRLLCDASEMVATVRSRRFVTRTCAGLIRQTREDAAGLRGLFEAGDPTPFEYIRLGEVAEAARAVRVRASAGRPEDERPAGASPAHISTPRLDAHIRRERETLGEAAFESIGGHLERCDACRGEAERRRQQIGVA
jgi:hypothetical protein